MPTGPAPGMPDLNDPSLYGGRQDEQGNWSGMTNVQVPPTETIAGDTTVQAPAVVEGQPIIPTVPVSDLRNATAQFTEAEWNEIRAGLDQNFGDESVGTVEGQQGTGEPAGGPGTATGEAPTPPGVATPGTPITPDPYAGEVEIAGVRVPQSDQEALAAIYTALRNKPEVAPTLIDLVQKANTGIIPPAPVPDQPYAWQTPPISPPVITPPPPGQVQIQLPPGVDLDDPMVQWQAAQIQQIQQNQAQVIQLLQQQQVAKQEVSTVETRKANIDAGVARFSAMHPELNRDQIGQLANRLGQAGLMIGLVQKLPEDQATARGLELMYAEVRPSLANGTGTNNPALDARSRTLTALAGGSASGAVSREPPPAAPPSSDREARQQATEWLRKSGVDLGSPV